MNVKDFWMDVLRTAAIIGLVMSLSHVIEKYLLLFSDMTITRAFALILLESIVSAGLFVGLIYHFTRRVAKNWQDRIEVAGQMFEVKFSYSRALSYILMSTMLAGVVVGVTCTIFIDVVEYDVYIASVIARLQELRAMMAPYASVVTTGPSVDATISQQIELIESQERATMFINILSYVSTYMMYGGLVGLIVAAVARRNLNKQNDSEIKYE